MRVHPLFKTLLSRPELLAEHAGAYAELASVEVAQAARRARQRAVLAAAALGCAAAGSLLGGVALLALAVVPVSTMPAPWALAVVPGVPLLTAAALWFAQSRQAGQPSFARLREQWTLDQALIGEAGQARS